MAQDGLYTKLHLAVRARTQPGQVVLVSGSATSDRTSGALEMVTSPDQYPIWRTPKPVIIARGVRHDYRYSIRSAHDVEAEPGQKKRSFFVVITRPKLGFCFLRVEAEPEIKKYSFFDRG